MTLDLASIPDDLVEASPKHEQEQEHDRASEPANDPACLVAPEVPAEPASRIPHSAASPLLQENPVLAPKAAAIYPNDHFIHALYGGFMDTPELPGIPRADRWKTFLDAYTNPELSHHFDGAELPSA